MMEIFEMNKLNCITIVKPDLSGTISADVGTINELYPNQSKAMVLEVMKLKIADHFDYCQNTFAIQHGREEAAKCEWLTKWRDDAQAAIDAALEIEDLESIAKEQKLRLILLMDCA